MRNQDIRHWPESHKAMLAAGFVATLYVIFLVALLVLVPSKAFAQQHKQTESRIIYGPDGKRAGSTYRDTQGTLHFYDAQGRRAGTAALGSDGTRTVYGQDGRRQGTISPPSPPTHYNPPPSYNAACRTAGACW